MSEGTIDRGEAVIWLDPKRECHCRFDDPIPGQEATFDGSDRTAMSNIVTFGWHIVQIPDEPQSSGWVFSVGMWHTLGSPEISLFGMDAGDAAHAINQIGAHVRAGRGTGPGVVFDDVLADGRRLTFRQVDSSWYRPLFGYATWFGRRPPLPIAQAVWADVDGRFPWEVGDDNDYRFLQPSLWIPGGEHPMGRWSGALIEGDWPFPDPPDTAAITTKRIGFERHPVLYVVHNSNGDWQFLDGQDLNPQDAVVVHLAHVAGAHAGVLEIADLPRGWEAFRQTEPGPWTRRQMVGED